MSKKEKTKQGHRQWVITVVFLSFGLSVVMSILTSVFVESAELLVALMTLIVLILIGIITDIIGTAVTSASEQPFIAMASKRTPGPNRRFADSQGDAFPTCSMTLRATLSAW